MDIQILRKFLAVAKAGSITKAADALHISQPPLSRQLHDLEAELGTPLFERTNRRTTLTPDGLLLQKRAEEILSIVEKTQSELQNAKHGIKGDIYIGAGESAAMSYVAKWIKGFQKRCPFDFDVFFPSRGSGNTLSYTSGIGKGTAIHHAVKEPRLPVRYHVTSSDGEDLREWLDKGIGGYR